MIKTFNIENPFIPHNDEDVPDIVELKNVSQHYGENVIFNNINLLVEKGVDRGIVKVILGPSGCGKSTLLRYIAGLQSPTNGDILIKGRPQTSKDVVGMVFQKYSSFPWKKVKGNISYGESLKTGFLEKVKNFFMDKKSPNDDKLMDIIKTVGLSGHEDKFAQYPILSGGQLQRVAIARSLFSTPEILLMDEPFGALDISTRLQMQKLLLKIYTEMKTTIIMVTHDISEAIYLADEIYIMSNAPAYFKHYINVKELIPRNEKLERDKRSPEFINLTQKIEDLMLSL